MAQASPNQRRPRRASSGRSTQGTIALRRAVAIGAIALVVLGGGYFVATSVLGASAAERAAERFGDLWEQERWADMWALLTPDARRQVTAADFANAYQEAALTATTDRVSVGEAEDGDGATQLPVSIETSVWGAIDGTLELGVEDERIAWSPELVFPGLREGERLSRETEAPERAALLDVDGGTLVEGDGAAREAAVGALAGTVAVPDDQAYRDRLYAEGFPEEQPAGVSGLELAFEDELHGIPGGTLMAGTREIASAEPRAAEPARTTIDPAVQQAAVNGLAGRVGGIVVLDARSGEVRGVGGGGLTDAHPPGSTFKIVTLGAVLEEGIADPDTEFPVEGSALIDGYRLKNAHGGELCGGTLVESFAHSCNSVFAPLGAELGADKLVEAAESFGVNRSPSIPGATESTLPPASEFDSDLDAGVSAIGQGELLTTPLTMASITQAIANQGKLVEPRLDPTEPREVRRVLPKDVAKQVGEMMEAVVTAGTGGSAAVPGTSVAGKTGTAEAGLAAGVAKRDQPEDHAWFTAYAPADKPKLALAVFIANAGFGGDVAAPVAAEILTASLGSK